MRRLGLKRFSKVDWNEFQEIYNQSINLGDACEKYNVGYRTVKKGIDAGVFVLADNATRQTKTKISSITTLTPENLIYIQTEYTNGKSIRDLVNENFNWAQVTYALNGITRTLSQANKNKIKVKGTTSPSVENRRKTSIRQSLHNSGGKSKWYEVAGQKVQGTWERDIATKFEELKIKWYKPKVNNDIWPYTINEIIRNYTPDFYLPDYDVYLEIKGHWWGNDKEKMLAVSQQHSDKRLVLVLKEQYDKIMGGEQVW